MTIGWIGFNHCVILLEYCSANNARPFIRLPTLCDLIGASLNIIFSNNKNGDSQATQRIYLAASDLKIE